MSMLLALTHVFHRVRGATIAYQLTLSMVVLLLTTDISGATTTTTTVVGFPFTQRPPSSPFTGSRPFSFPGPWATPPAPQSSVGFTTTAIHESTKVSTSTIAVMTVTEHSSSSSSITIASPSQTSSAPAQNAVRTTTHTAAIAGGAAAGCIVILLLLALLGYFAIYRRQRKSNLHASPFDTEATQGRYGSMKERQSRIASGNPAEDPPAYTPHEESTNSNTSHSIAKRL